MPNQKTLSIIKPDAVKAGHVDAINLMIENSGLKILEKKEIKLIKKKRNNFMPFILTNLFIMNYANL